MPRRILRRWIKRLIRYRYWLLALGVVLGVAAAIVGRGLSLNRSLDNMFAKDDPILVPYRRLQRTFGEHEIILAVYEDPQFKSPAGLDRVAELVKQLRAVPGIVAVISILDPPSASDFDDTGRGALFRDMFSGYTHNSQLDAAGAICLIQRPGPQAVPRGEILASLERIIHKYPRGAIVGEPVLVEEGFDLLEEDGRRLNTWCTVLVLLTILACVRRVRWLILPLAVVQLTLALTYATLVLSHLELSMVSSMLASIVTVVGVASVVHIMVHYIDERRHGFSRPRALMITLDELAAPILVAILTDAAGFAALMVSRVGPVHDFGFMMAVGSLMVLPSCILLVPAIAWRSDSHPHAPSAKSKSGSPSARHDERLARWLKQLLAWANRHVRALGVAAVVVTSLSVVGSGWLKLETDFTKNFRDDSEIVQAYKFVEERFGGAGVWDLLIPAPKTLDKNQLLEMLELENELKLREPHLTKAISLADGLSAGLGGVTRLKLAPAFALNAGLSVMRARMVEFIDAIYHTDPADGRQWMHVMLRSPERLDAETKTEVIQSVQTIAAEKYPEAQVTGYYVLLASLIQSLLADQWKAFLVATIVVGAMIMIAIRDWRLTAITFVPNIFPSLILFGVMGWLGLRVNMGVAMIAAVSIGLSVDGSVHYTMFYQRLRRRGLSLEAALDRSQDSIGRAAVFSTLALTVGFATLCVSDFVPTIYFGALVSLNMIGGLIGNIVILPILIRLVDRRAYA